MPEPLLQVERLFQRFGGVVASNDLSLAVQEGELHAVIGPNGAGKTTLINQITGQLTGQSGSIRFAGRDVTRLPVHRRALLGLARSFQITSLLLDFSALDNVALAVQARPRAAPPAASKEMAKVPRRARFIMSSHEVSFTRETALAGPRLCPRRNYRAGITAGARRPRRPRPRRRQRRNGRSAGRA